MYHEKFIMYHEKFIMYLDKYIMFHDKYIMFHEKYIMYHEKFIMFHEKYTMYHEKYIMYHEKFMSLTTTQYCALETTTISGSALNMANIDGKRLGNITSSFLPARLHTKQTHLVRMRHVG